jgi:hypothetical protein
MPIKQGGMLAGGHLCPSELFVEQPFSVLVNPMDLENVFCQIDSNSFNVHDSSSVQ